MRAALAVRSSSTLEDTWESSRASTFHSVTDVKPEKDAIGHAIDRVIESYGEHKDGQEVLIQPMVTDVTFSCVVFTRDLDTGGPYYVINYDDYSGRTDTVTSGAFNKMAMVHRPNPDALHSPRMRKVIAAVMEIEAVTGCEELDIEFCGTENLNIHILQVRPLAAKSTWHPVPDKDIAEALAGIRETLAGLQKVNREWREYWRRRFDDPLSDAESLRLDAEGRIVDIGGKVSE